MDNFKEIIVTNWKRITFVGAFLIAILAVMIVFSTIKSNGNDSNKDTQVASANKDINTGKNTNNDEKDVKDEEKEEEKEEEPFRVKALYLTGWTAGIDTKLDHFIDIANKTEVNSLVIDIRDNDGYVSYETQIPEVRAYKGWQKKFDPKTVLPKLKANNIYAIARLVCFKDPVLSKNRPEFAIKHVNGRSWTDNFGKTWLDPYKKGSWPIIVAIAKEALELGFDEIQFDYIRFGNDGNRDAMVFDHKGIERYEIINEFIAYARKEMPEAKLTADVFGIIFESPEDTEKIGQYLELIGKDHLDYLCPMVYPSHYALGQKLNKVEYLKPDFEPYGVVFNTLVKGKQRIAAVEGYRANIRPYLQDFTATWLGKGYYKSYGADEVREQINAVYDAGYTEWILWNAVNRYSEEAFLPEGEVSDKEKRAMDEEIKRLAAKNTVTEPKNEEQSIEETKTDTTQE